MHPPSPAAALDAADPLRGMRERFVLPEGVIYLDGNSLGCLPKSVATRVAKAVSEEWGVGLIRSWNAAGWIDLPRVAGAKLARLIGAPAGSVVAADSTSINLFKVLSAALELRPGRRGIVSESGNFPTDLYVAEGVMRQLGEGHALRLAKAPEDLAGLLNADTAVLMLTHVNFRDGRMHDMAAVTKAAQAAGALVIWDLAHSAGAMPLDLAGAGADFAIGCGYKFLNGGPGAPAFVYVHPRWHGKARQPLTGWFSHKAPFNFDASYCPAGGIEQFLCGTPPVLNMVAFDEALSLWDDVDMTALRQKSQALCDLFIARIDAFAAEFGLTLITPREGGLRGSQVSYTCPHGYAVMQALIARGVIGDFRAPDIIRFGFAPLYLSYAEAERAAAILEEILRSRAWDDARFHARRAVT